jgi:hypothetical protein
MAENLHVRNLDDDLIARLKRRAARHGRSICRAPKSNCYPSGLYSGD